MPLATRRTLSAVVVAGLLLTGCSTTVVRGTASPGKGEPVDVGADEFPITGVSQSGIDHFARNALADLNAFWAQAHPEFSGEEFRPLENGYSSVDSGQVDEGAYQAT